MFKKFPIFLFCAMIMFCAYMEHQKTSYKTEYNTHEISRIESEQNRRNRLCEFHPIAVLLEDELNDYYDLNGNLHNFKIDRYTKSKEFSITVDSFRRNKGWIEVELVVIDFDSIESAVKKRWDLSKQAMTRKRLLDENNQWAKMYFEQ